MLLWNTSLLYSLKKEPVLVALDTRSGRLRFEWPPRSWSRWVRSFFRAPRGTHLTGLASVGDRLIVRSQVKAGSCSSAFHLAAFVTAVPDCRSAHHPQSPCRALCLRAQPSARPTACTRSSRTRARCRGRGPRASSRRRFVTLDLGKGDPSHFSLLSLPLSLPHTPSPGSVPRGALHGPRGQRTGCAVANAVFGGGSRGGGGRRKQRRGASPQFLRLLLPTRLSSPLSARP